MGKTIGLVFKDTKKASTKKVEEDKEKNKEIKPEGENPNGEVQE